MVTAVDIIGGNLCIIGSNGDDIDRFTRLRQTGSLGRYVSDKASLHCGAWWVEEKIHDIMMTGLLFHIVRNKLVVTHGEKPVYFFIRIDDTWDDQDAIVSLVEILKWNKDEIAASATAAFSENKPQQPTPFRNYLQEEEHISKRTKNDSIKVKSEAGSSKEKKTTAESDNSYGDVDSSGKDESSNNKSSNKKKVVTSSKRLHKSKNKIDQNIEETVDKVKGANAASMDVTTTGSETSIIGGDEKLGSEPIVSSSGSEPIVSSSGSEPTASSSGIVSDEIFKLQQILQQKEDEHAEKLRVQEVKHRKSLANQTARQRKERELWIEKEAASQHESSTHKTELERLIAERDEAKRQQTDALQKAEQYKQCVSSSTPASGLKHPKELIQLLCETATQTYRDLAIQLKGVTAQFTTSEFQFYNGNIWIDLTDSHVVHELQILRKSVESGSPVKVSYSFNNHSYEVEYNPSSKSADDKYIQLNNNPQYMTKRWIRDTPPPQPDNPNLTQDIKSNVLFGHNAPLVINTLDIIQWLNQYDFNVGESVELSGDQLSLSLAKLATTFASFGSQFNYLSSDPSKCRCESFVKPVALKMWLKLAESRGYTNARVVMHGGSTAEYNAIKNDHFGFNMRYASNPYMGQRGNGTAHGQGIYFGLSDHVTKSYNTDTSRGGTEKTGSGILSLFLSESRLDTATGSYTVFSLSHPDPQSDFGNCVVVHELPLILALGKIVPADP